MTRDLKPTTFDESGGDSGDELESLLGLDLAQRLDPQRGRALAAFERASTPARPPRRSRRWIPLAIGSALAASVLIAWMVARNEPAGGSRQRHVAGSIVAPAAPTAPTAPAAPTAPLPRVAPGGFDADDAHRASAADAADAADAAGVAGDTGDAGGAGVERLVLWRAVDEGARVIDAAPVRRVRVEAMQEIHWADPELSATFRLTVPQQQVVFVQQPSF